MPRFPPTRGGPSARASSAFTSAVRHADLNAHNILIDSRGEVFLIDFDRGRRRAPGGWTQRNLQRLRRSLDKISVAFASGRFTDEHWQFLLEGYARQANAAR